MAERDGGESLLFLKKGDDKMVAAESLGGPRKAAEAGVGTQVGLTSK